MERKLPRKLCRMFYYGSAFAWAGASGTADYFAGFIGNKLSIPLGQMFFRAVLCNFFVCLGVLCGMKLKSDAGRFLMITMCISGFVVSGFDALHRKYGNLCYCILPGTWIIPWSHVKEYGSSNFRKYGGRCPVAGMAAQKDECR